MPLRTIATFAIAIVLGLIAVVFINFYIGSSKKTQVAQVQAGIGSPVVVAAAPITRGVVIQPQLLKVVNYPAGSVPQGAFTAVAQIATGNKDTQRIALRDLSPDEPVLATRVTAPGAKLSMATELDPGMQAITLHSSDVQGVAGFVFPNDRVDVLLSRAVAPRPGSQALPLPLTQVIAENVKVVGIDQSDDEEQSKPSVAKVVTVEVTPEQAQAITLAQSMGTVSFALRHVQDTAPVNRLVTTAASFGFFAAPAPAATRRIGPVGPTVRVTRGADTSVVELAH
jgi:pilus assembly protein CpaB